MIGDYEKINFINNVTPLDADNMGKMDDKIAELDQNVGTELYDMVLTQTSYGDWVTEDDHLIITEDEEEEILLEYPFCNCNNVRTTLEKMISALEDKINEITAALENVLATE